MAHAPKLSLVAGTRPFRPPSLKTTLRRLYIDLMAEAGPGLLDRLDAAWLAGWRAHGTMLYRRNMARRSSAKKGGA